MKNLLLAFLLLLGLATGGLSQNVNGWGGSGGTLTVESVEWKTMDSPLVVRGKVIAVKDSTPGPFYPDGTIKIAVAEVLRGEWKEAELEVYTKAPPGNLTAQQWLKSDHEYLFFLRTATAKTDSSKIAGAWVFRTAQPRDAQSSVCDLAAPKGAFGADMKVLPDEKQILDRVRAWSAQSSREIDLGGRLKEKAGAIRLAVPVESTIRAEFADNLHHLHIMVPGEEKHREQAFKLMADDNPRRRAEGAQILANLPDDAESIKQLQWLLGDSGEVVSFYSGHELARISYPARDAAWKALTYLGRQPEVRPSVQRDPSEQERRKFRLGYWSKSIAEALGKDWKVISMGSVAAPPGWTRRQGADGFVFKCQKGEGEKPAALTFYVMPRELVAVHSPAWVADTDGFALNDAMQLATRKITKRKYPAEQTATYLGIRDYQSQGQCHVFVLPQCPAEIRQGLVKQWELKISKD